MVDHVPDEPRAVLDRFTPSPPMTTSLPERESPLRYGVWRHLALALLTGVPGGFVVFAAGCGGGGEDDASCCDPSQVWGEISVTLNPRSTLSAMVEATTTIPVRVAVEFTDSMGFARRTNWSAPGLEHELVVVGMRAKQSYELEVVAQASSDADDVELARASRTFETGALPPDTRLPVSVDVEDGAYRSSYTLVGPGRRPTLDPPADTNEPLAYALDGEGEVVWYYADVTVPNYFIERDVKQRADGALMVNVPNGLRLIDIAGRELLTLLSPDPKLIIHHDNIFLPGGGYLSLTRENRVVLAPSQGGDVLLSGDGLLEWDPEGNVVWQWSTFDHLDVDRFPGFLSATGSVFGGGALDWTHGNGLFYREDTNSYLVSLRHQNWVVDVARETGEVRWILGDGGDFSLANGGGDAAAEWFYSQHAPSMDPDGTILLYDNGNERPNAPDSYSRAVRYRLDEDTMVATQEWSYAVENYTLFLGGAESLADGGVLVCAGGVLGVEAPAEIVEVPPDPVAPTRWRIVYGSDSVVYRATRISSFYPGQ